MISTQTTPATPPAEERMEKPHTEAQKRKKKTYRRGSNQQPRWHNQAYMLFLALRQHSEATMARTDLIKSALAIDKRISEDLLVPKVFRGKTPMNSASAILTNNSDRYFIPFKPDGSKSMHFKLSFEPGSYSSALKEYTEWQERLIKYNWPYYFDDTDIVVQSLAITQKAIYATEFDEFIAKRKKARLSQAVIRVPQSWQEIISLRKNSGSSSGVYANRKLKRDVPLGYYFGVPMTEDEFDAIKDGVGQASDYAYMYRKTVIDPTDKAGQLYLLKNGLPMCPFHYVKATSIREKANVGFYEGQAINQIVCWTKKDILPGEELLVYIASSTSLVGNSVMKTNGNSILNTTSSAIVSTTTTNDEYWQKKPSISNLLNTTISPV